MQHLLDLAVNNLLSPAVLFFIMGVLAALARAELSIPEAIAKTLALYLMMAIGFKGGVEVAKSGLTLDLITAMIAGIVLSAILPAIGFWFLQNTTKLDRVNSAAVAAHYGSISIVTFIAATQALQSLGIGFEGYMIAVAAVMETPAILVALLLAGRSGESPKSRAHLWHEVTLNASVVMLVGSFLIGWATGEPGAAQVKPFLQDIFRGVLCLFLLDMGLVAGRGLKSGFRTLQPSVLAFGIYMPLMSAGIAALICYGLGISTGGAALLITLAASASYIAVPAAMRLALPDAQPSIYLTLSLAITFPFNLSIGIPLYLWLAEKVS
jgi:uncharacterized protein